MTVLEPHRTRTTSKQMGLLLALSLVLVPLTQACGSDGGRSGSGSSDVTVDHSSAGNPPDLSTTLVPPPGDASSPVDTGPAPDTTP